jgi:hypothetical protein
MASSSQPLALPQSITLHHFGAPSGSDHVRMSAPLASTIGMSERNFALAQVALPLSLASGVPDAGLSRFSFRIESIHITF